MAWLIFNWLRAQRLGSVFDDTGSSHNGGLDTNGGAGATCGDNPALVDGVGVINKPKDQDGSKPSPLRRGGMNTKSNKTAVVPIETLVVTSSSRKRNQRRRAAKKMAKSLSETGSALDGGGRKEDSGRTI